MSAHVITLHGREPEESWYCHPIDHTQHSIYGLDLPGAIHDTVKLLQMIWGDHFSTYSMTELRAIHEQSFLTKVLAISQFAVN